MESVIGSKGFNKHGLHAQIGEPRADRCLHLGGQQQHRNLRGGRILAQFPKGRWSIHSRHHHIQQNGIRLIFGGARQSLRTGTRHGHFPARHGLQAQCCYFANIVFVINDKNAMSMYSSPTTIYRPNCGFASPRSSDSNSRRQRLGGPNGRPYRCRSAETVGEASSI